MTLLRVLCAVCGVLGAGSEGRCLERQIRKMPRAWLSAEAPHPVSAALIAEHRSIQPGGTTRLAVVLTMERGWHVYAPEPGDAGLPTKISWSALSGVSFGAVAWPKPKAFVDPGDIRTFGYEGRAVFVTPVRLEGGSAPENPVQIHATVRWLACQEACLLGSAELALALPLHPDPPEPSADAALFPPPHP